MMASQKWPIHSLTQMVYVLAHSTRRLMSLCFVTASGFM